MSVSGGNLLKPGSILLVHCYFCTPRKSKFYILVATKPFANGFFINSEPTAFQKSNKHFMDDLLPIRQIDYPKLLKYDSFIDCTTPLDEFSINELEAHVMADPGKNYLGEITRETAQEIRRIVANSLHIENWRIKSILSNLDAGFPSPPATVTEK
jgi:hypothetical protein